MLKLIAITNDSKKIILISMSLTYFILSFKFSRFIPFLFLHKKTFYITLINVIVKYSTMWKRKRKRKRKRKLKIQWKRKRKWKQIQWKRKRKRWKLPLPLIYIIRLEQLYKLIGLRKFCVFGFPHKCNQFCNFHYTIQYNAIIKEIVLKKSKGSKKNQLDE